MSWYTFEGADGTSTDGTFSLTGTIGQPDAGELSGGTFVMHGGYIPWDIRSDGLVNASDLAGVLGRWGLVDGVPAGDRAADFDSSGAVNAADPASLLGHPIMHMQGRGRSAPGRALKARRQAGVLALL